MVGIPFTSPFSFKLNSFPDERPQGSGCWVQGVGFRVHGDERPQSSPMAPTDYVFSQL
jgi:hypothetical protein